MACNGSSSHLTFHSGDADLKRTGDSPGYHFMHGCAAFRRSDGDVGPHASRKGEARSFLRHTETDGDSIDGLAGFVRNLHGDAAGRLGACNVDCPFTLEHTDVEKGLGLCRGTTDEE